MTGSFRSLIVVAVIGILIVALDQASKIWVTNNIPLYEAIAPIAALAPYFRIVHTTNTGIAFGLLRGGGAIFALVNGAASVAILVYAYKLKNASPLMLLALGLVLGGAVGNLIDRARYGQVVDFIDVRYSDSLVFPSFNVADSSIVIGVILLAVMFYLQERRAAEVTPNV